MGRGLTPDGNLIRLGLFSTGSVNHQVDLAVLDLIDDIRSAFTDFEHGLNVDSVLTKTLAVPLVATISTQGQPAFLRERRWIFCPCSSR